MEKFGRRLGQVAIVLAALTFVAAYPVANRHAHLQSRAAHERWGTSTVGTAVGFKGDPTGDVDGSYRPTVIRFVTRAGKNARVTRLMYWKTQIGDTFSVWRSTDGKVFVNHDRESGDKSYRTEPFPVGLGTYLWRLGIFGILALIIGIGGYRLGEALEDKGKDRRRSNIRLAA